ncbi:DUF2750 domain-containing protein [Lacimicrobium sp. SS2-24]|uniref:DUF2750 domain-containing protein n=1 Tax=Lacimicrobium sp. SS2-24 TaxID=2005569 RepID=UPI000B4A9874|nr:DUF2750 domain-containing protein [Lacimicrobium sp. SS2-24]
MNPVSQDKYSLLAQNPEQRAEYLFTTIKQQGDIWTLVDDDGAMILTSDDEDCIPVWPDEVFAQDWINGDWSQCRAYRISLEDWLQRWLPGLEEDDIQIALFPVPAEEGLILPPWEMKDKLS